ncbi:hypothetical protein CP533_4780 [Ophiocordyceps camponoti-saundersi (nom. inval.)]|nr:hypothetical protein CP533_4780 [Ophiocordyceps camponoti-saundersi (nom. inval.)]
MASLLCPRVSCALLKPAARSVSWKTMQASRLGIYQRRDETPPRWLPTMCRRSFLFRTKSRGVVTRYEELPRSYRDAEGLPFGRRDLYLGEIRRIFGPEMDTDEGNRLLRILQGRRVAGTLKDPSFAVHTARFSAQQLEEGLAYLRRTTWVDEVLSAGLRAEDELKLMELEMEGKQKTKGKKKLAQGKEQGQQESEAVKQTSSSSSSTTTTEDDDNYKPNPVYGRSVLDEIRARNIAKRKAQEKALEEERQASQAAGNPGDGAVTPMPEESHAVTDQPRKFKSARLAKYYEEAQSGLKEPPVMSAWQRILPSATVVLLVVGLLVGVCAVYEEPTERYRLFREISASQATVGTLIGINVLAFVCWKTPPLWKYLNKYMTMVVGMPRAVTALTSMFSHQSPVHLLVNMVPLWIVGTRLHDDLGRAEFLALYVACGGIGYIGSLTCYTLLGQLGVSSLGSSGCTLGVISAYLWEKRREGLRMFGLPRDGVHGVVLLGILAAAQLAGMCRIKKLPLDFFAHLTGMATGVIDI